MAKKYKSKRLTDFGNLVMKACEKEGCDLKQLCLRGPFSRRTINYYLAGERLIYDNWDNPVIVPVIPENILVIRRLCEMAGEDFESWRLLLTMEKDDMKFKASLRKREKEELKMKI